MWIDFAGRPGRPAQPAFLVAEKSQNRREAVLQETKVVLK
jgi:hypothetical protein